jgi:hypothetical protein
MDPIRQLLPLSSSSFQTPPALQTLSKSTLRRAGTSAQNLKR